MITEHADYDEYSTDLLLNRFLLFYANVLEFSDIVPELGIIGLEKDT